MFSNQRHTRNTGNLSDIAIANSAVGVKVIVVDITRYFIWRDIDVFIKQLDGGNLYFSTSTLFGIPVCYDYQLWFAYSTEEYEYLLSCYKSYTKI